MTDLLWMPASDGRGDRSANPNYIRSFDAKVQKVMDGWALLDRTAFYAEGGGQPSDIGTLTWDGGQAKVTSVTKKGAVKHTLEGDLPPAGATVHGDIDWDHRLKHMRMHTSQHLLSGVVWKLRKGRTAGNQIHADRSRVDFEPVKFEASDLRDIENEVNRLLAANLPILVYEQDRTVLEERLAQTGGGDRSLLGIVPQSVKRLRIVEIADPEDTIPTYGRTIDMCPCAGTHVARTNEIGMMEIIGRETKGTNRERVEYVLKQ
ncbi:MAG: alanyl-tRNA editing protein [Candidatus Thermoplasmatota archaeon]